MKQTVIIEPEAEEELLAAIDWYEEHRRGLGKELFRAVEKTIDQLGSPVDRSLPFPGVASDLGVRRILVNKFPFAVVFMKLKHETRILAIAHLKKRPGYWRYRL